MTVGAGEQKGENREDFTDIIDKIEDARSDNNGLWMRILRIALRADPDETKRVLREINRNDKYIAARLGEIGDR